jgi:dTDP-4-amino-4,6-dideoxygalactose transaminase
MAAILSDIKPGDEVIIPSFTFVSTANAFVLRGAKIVFADSSENIPNIDVEKVEDLITENTKAIVVVHYAGVACDMDKVMDLAEKYNLFVIEDSAHAIDSYYKNKPLGSIGNLGAFSFHETKNIISGEGGMLTVNDERFIERAEIIWEKGTNRAAFFRGKVKKYGWVDVGSSFLPSDIIAAILFGQISKLQDIQKMRLAVWNNYYNKLKPLEEKGLL